MSPHPPKTRKPFEVSIFDDGFDENPNVAYSNTVMRQFDPACTQNCPIYQDDARFGRYRRHA